MDLLVASVRKEAVTSVVVVMVVSNRVGAMVG